MLAESFKSALQRLYRAPAHSLGLLATLTLGLSLTIAMFAVVYGVAFAPLPYPDDQQIVVVESQRPRSGAQGAVTPREALQLLPATAGLSAFAYYSWGGADLMVGDRPHVLTINTVSGAFFDVFRVAPLLGRVLRPDDIGKPRAVLSHATWVKQLSQDPDIVGKTLKLNWIDAQIVGVMPPDFAYPSEEVAMWIAADESTLTAMDPAVFNNARFLNAIARMQTGLSAAQLSAQLAAYTPVAKDSDDWVLRATGLLDSQVDARRPLLLALLGIAVLVLLIACANAAHLVMVRGFDRLGQFGVMRALGASQTRIASGFLLEVGIVSALALLLSLVLATAGLHTFVGLVDSGLPRAAEIAISTPVVAFALLNTVMILLLCGVWPALRLHKGGIQAALARRIGVSAGVGGFERALPIVAIALSLAALSTAALLAISAQRLANQDELANVDQILAVQLFPGNREPNEVAHYLEQTRLAAAALPGIEQAVLMSGAPFTAVGSLRLDISLPGAPAGESQTLQARAISGPALSVLGIGLLRGRAFEPGDRTGSVPVALLNERAARELFKGVDPLGQRVAVPPYGSGGDSTEFEVVGIVEDRKLDRVDTAAARAEIWLPFAQYSVPFGSLLLSSPLPPKSLIASAEAAVWSVDREQGIYRSFAVAAERDLQLAAPRFFARNAGVFAVFALVLSMVGVYAVLAVDLSRRRRELALRAALGASRRDALRFVGSKGLAIGIPGTLLGLALAAAMAQAVRGWLFDVDASTPWIVVLSASLPMFLLTMLVCWDLARRALRVAPNLALREQ